VIKNGRYLMGLLIFIVAVLFVLGAALLLLRSANSDKLPTGIKVQPYEEDDDKDDQSSSGF